MTGIAAPARVQLIAQSEFLGADTGNAAFFTDTDDGGSATAEFAGRACYQSWDKPNPKTATNAGYLDHIKEVGHGSVLEHSQRTFYVTGVSRTFTHELIRHRHLSYSQLSQRFVNESSASMVIPPLVAEIARRADTDAELMESVHDILDEMQQATSVAAAAYDKLAHHFEDYLEGHTELASTAARKTAREAARAVLPNMTETRIVVSGNDRAWRQFIAVRATEHADAEIRCIAIEILKQLQQSAPNVFGDFTIEKLRDDVYIAHTEYSA